MRKWLLGGLGLLCIVLAGSVVVVRLNSDREGPEITFHAEAENVYTEGQKEEKLLEGVNAQDEKDGDVTNSLQIESIYPTEDGKQVIVVYTAKDSSNNVTKKKRKMEYQSGGGNADENARQQSEEQGAAEDISDTANAQAAVQTESASLSEEEKALKTAEDAIAALAPEAPRLRLKEYYVKAAKGSAFDRLGYVTEITDDKDASNELWRRIQISGEPDMQTPGTYELIYSVTDKDGNSSNQAKMTVIVE